jgi:hypothetical protein
MKNAKVVVVALDSATGEYVASVNGVTVPGTFPSMRAGYEKAVAR